MRSLKEFYLDYLYEIRRKPSQWGEALAFYIAWHLPRTLVSCCFIRVFAAITTGDYNRCATEVTCAEALQFWHNEEKDTTSPKPELVEDEYAHPV